MEEEEKIRTEVEEIKYQLKYNRIEKYIINPDNTVKALQSVQLDLSRINVVFSEVTQNFSLRNMNLYMLPTCPKKVWWNVLINQNNLTSLKGLPEFIYGSLFMKFNNLEHSQENFDILLNTYIGESIEGDEDFMIAFERYRTIKDITDS